MRFEVPFIIWEASHPLQNWLSERHGKGGEQKENRTNLSPKRWASVGDQTLPKNQSKKILLLVAAYAEWETEKGPR